jgi:DNA-binding MarR family transcriptional regulator
MARSTGERHVTLVTLLLHATHRMIDELIDRVVAAGYPDIRPSDSRVFENLDPSGTRLNELAVRSHMTHQSMSELVIGLESRGYVQRMPDPADRRARLVCLTPRGRELMRVALTALAEIETEWLRRLETVGCDDLRGALIRLTELEEYPASIDGVSRR